MWSLTWYGLTTLFITMTHPIMTLFPWVPPFVPHIIPPRYTTLQMEQYFDLHEVQLLQKVHIASLYLEPNQFLWYRGLCSRKPLVTWSIFMEEMIAHYEDTKSNTFSSQLINLKQKASIAEDIEDFQNLNIRVNDIPEKKRIDVFIGTLKENIQHEVRLWEPDSLEKPFRLARKI